MPVAYDCAYALDALRSLYDVADEIVLGLDADRISWAGRPFRFPDYEFCEATTLLDVAGKITMVEENFHASGNPLANDTYERQVLADSRRIKDSWVVQIDSDEILLNPVEFAKFLREFGDETRDVEYHLTWATVWKRFGDQYLVVDPATETQPCAAWDPRYVGARRVAGRRAVLSPLRALHLSFGRTEAELIQKLTSWGHAKDFDVMAYVDFWRSVTLDNYRDVRNFHPIVPETWPGLRLVAAKDAPALYGAEKVDELADA
jgi:hypothetical protein